METSEKEYVTITLTTGQVILTKMNLSSDEDGFYKLESPMKPIVLTETNNIALVSMNPFSDSIDFKVHAMHIVSVGSLDANYIEMYDNAVTALHKTAKQKIEVMFNMDDEIPDLDDDDDELEITPDIEITKTIH
jgi:hypothetical protein